MNGWTKERQQRQAQLIRQWQPWQLSTGAKTAEGKTISARNAYRGGLRQQIKDINKLLRESKQVLNDLG